VEVRIKRKESIKIQYLLLKMIAGFGDSGAERYHLYKKIDLAVKHSVLPTRQKALNYLSKLRIRGYVAFYNRNGVKVRRLTYAGEMYLNRVSKSVGHLVKWPITEPDGEVVQDKALSAKIDDLSAKMDNLTKHMSAIERRLEEVAQIKAKYVKLKKIINEIP
jgi:hypothetical protein